MGVDRTNVTKSDFLLDARADNPDILRDRWMYTLNLMPKKPFLSEQIRWHRRFDGIFARVARQVQVDPSQVSRVASGKRSSIEITAALEKEMGRLEKLKP